MTEFTQLEVARTVELRVDLSASETKYYRIEALQDNGTTVPGMRFSARVYVNQYVPASNIPSEQRAIWVEDNHVLGSGGAQGDTADIAIRTAVSFIKQSHSM